MIFNKLHSLRNIKIIRRFYNDPNTAKADQFYLYQLYKQQQKIKASTSKCTPSQISIQVIGPGTRGGCRSVLLVTDNTNYLFNCGEGTQRVATEYHARLTNVEHIFVTKPTWENMGGIPGIALTIQEAGIPTIYMHGPDGLIDFIELIENFMTLEKLSIVAANATQKFSDQTMTVTYIPIHNPKQAEDSDFENSNLAIDKINYFNYEIDSPSHSSGKRTFRVRSTESMSRIEDMMVFVCKVHGKKATLDIEKCVAAGVTPGPSLKKLKSGEDITLKDGRIVKSKDVVSPSEPGPLFIVLECPNEDWIDVIVNNPAFEKYQHETTADKDQVAHYVIHFSPDNVLQNPKYKEWIRKFGLKTQHLVINENNNGLTSEAQHKMQHQLHLIHPNIFPYFEGQENFIEDSNHEDKSLNNMEIKEIKEEILESHCESSDSTSELTMIKNKNEAKISTTMSSNESNIHQCQTLNTFHLKPDKVLDTEKKVKIYPKKYIKEITNIDGFLDVHADLQKKLNAKTKTLEDRKEYPKLLLLGTGSSLTNEYRNKSGILLQLDEDKCILLDCGEGTTDQLLTFFGKSKIDRVLNSIKAVYISHLHADHHLGLIGLIKQRERVTNEPLFLLAPQHICLHLNFYHRRFESIMKQFRLVSNTDLLINKCTLSSTLANHMYNLLGVDKISTTFVEHCPYAYAIALTLKDGRKICYSGDSMPCDKVVKLANDSFLLIHEATIEDGSENKAIIKRHSTISQAISIGVKANAQFTLLTHFSQHIKVPLLPRSKESSIDFNRVGVAYDFMSVSLSELPLLSCFYPCLLHMYKKKTSLDEHDFKNE